MCDKIYFELKLQCTGHKQQQQKKRKDKLNRTMKTLISVKKSCDIFKKLCQILHLHIRKEDVYPPTDLEN